MEKLNKIRLLTDFSEVSENAVDYAILMAKKMALELEIMHIVNTPLDWVELTLEQENLYPEIKAEINQAKNKLNSLAHKFENNGIRTFQNLIFNIGVENIPKYIKEDKNSLLIMGSHGASGIKEHTIGSNAQQVIRKANCPVLIVKNKPTKPNLQQITFASTFDDQQHSAFKKIHSFSKLLDLKLALLYINTPYNFKETADIEHMLNTFCEHCEEKNCDKITYNAYNEERGLKAFTQETQIDILAMATEGRSSFIQLFSPSLTESIINHLDVPVLSIGIHH